MFHYCKIGNTQIRNNYTQIRNKKKNLEILSTVWKKLIVINSSSRFILNRKDLLSLDGFFFYYKHVIFLRE